MHNLLIRTDLLLSNNFDFIVSIWKFGIILLYEDTFLNNISLSLLYFLHCQRKWFSSSISKSLYILQNLSIFYVSYCFLLLGIEVYAGYAPTNPRHVDVVLGELRNNSRKSYNVV